MNNEKSQVGTVIKGHCPVCGANKNAEVAAYHYEGWDEVVDEHNSVYGGSSHYILKCRGCDVIYHKKSTWFSEDMDHHYNHKTNEWEGHCPEKISYWPPPNKREIPAWLDTLKYRDHGLGELFGDVYCALDNDLSILAAIAMRTTFDRSSELLGVDPALPFKDKLNTLECLGKVGKEERVALDALTDAGSAAAHRGWKPSPKELETMISIMEAFLYRVFILQEESDELKKVVPQKQKKKSP